MQHGVVDVAALRIADAERRVAVAAVGALANDLAAADVEVDGWKADPQVSCTQCTGQIPPSCSKCGVCSGCQSWV